MQLSSSDATFWASLLGTLAPFFPLYLDGSRFSRTIHLGGGFDELKQSTTFLFSGRVVFLVCPLHRVFFYVVSHKCTILWGVSGAMQQAYFVSSRIIFLIACIYLLALSIKAFLVVWWQGELYSLFFPDVTSTVGIWLVNYFRRCYKFLDLFRNFHSFERITSLCMCLNIEISPLEVRLVGPSIGYGLGHNIFELCFVHILAILRPMERR